MINGFNEIWNRGEIVDEWKETINFPIFKKVEENDPNNYRALIAILNAQYKIFAELINKRLKKD